MKKILFSLILGSAFQAHAYFPDVCSLEKMPLPASIQNPEMIAGYTQKIKSECYLQKRFYAASSKMQSTYSASIENMTVYRALRFISRPAYNNAKYSLLPVPLIFQASKASYNLPVEQRSNAIWQNWKVGILQINFWLQKIAAGQALTLADLNETHKGFYTVSDERGDYANAPNIGVMKPPTSSDRQWFKVEPAEDVERTKETVAAINLRYQEMGLLPPMKSSEPDIHLPLHIRYLADGPYMYGGDSRLNPQHLKNLFNFLNEMIKQGSQGQHMVWQGRLMTPGEVALFSQQFFVHIHPFNDGNGRISRLLQETVLNLFSLPFLSSGDLMAIDVLTTHENYYYIAMGKTFEQFDQIESCINDVYPRLFFRSGDLRQVSPDKIDYDCRLLE